LVAKVTKVFTCKIRAKKLSNYKSQASITGATKVLELTSKMKIQKEKEGNERKEEDFGVTITLSLVALIGKNQMHISLFIMICQEQLKTLNPTPFFTHSFSLCNFHNFAF
jgi:hypothetical protein